MTMQSRDAQAIKQNQPKQMIQEYIKEVNTRE